MHSWQVWNGRSPASCPLELSELLALPLLAASVTLPPVLAPVTVGLGVQYNLGGGDLLDAAGLLVMDSGEGFVVFLFKVEVHQQSLS